MKIVNKINIYFIGLFVLVALILSTAVGIYFYNITRSQTISYLFSSNKARAEHINTFLESQKELSSVLAAASVYRDFLKEPVISSQYAAIKDKITKRLDRTLQIDKNILELYILDKSGKVLASTDKDEEGQDRSKDEYFLSAQINTHIKSIYYYDPLQSLVYAVSSPVLDDDQSFLGVSVIIFSTDFFYNIVKNENGLGKTEENFLINKDKYFLTPSLFLGNSVVLKEKVLTQNSDNCFLQKEVDYVKQNGYVNLRQFAEREDIVEAKDYRGVDVVATHIYIPETGWCLITKVDRSDFLKPIAQLLLIILGIFVFSVILFILMGYYIARLITKPIYALVDEAKKVQEGDLSVEIGNKGKDEIGALSKNFELMISSVKKSRADIDKKVLEQTKEIVERQKGLEQQQKATLNILEDSEIEKNKTKAMLSSIADGVIATDVNTKVIYMNKSAEDLLGWKADEVQGKRLYDFLQMTGEDGKVMPEKDRPFYIALKVGKKIISSLEKSYYYTKRDGEKFPVTLSVTPVMINDKVFGAINVFRDITHDKEVDKAKTEFVSLASHQLRTPLSAINWYTEMLLGGDVGKITADQKRYLEEVYRSSKRMVDLVNSLLNVSRVDLGTFAIDPVPCDFAEISDSVLLELTPGIKTKNMVIERKYDKGLKKINADPKLTRIIFQNILSNAVKYTPEKGKISISIEKQDKNVLIMIKDTGYGIPKKDQGRIFEKLFRADNIREVETDGTGLGLYLIKAILAEAGGKIWFESEQNKGTTFFVEMPLSGMKAKEGAKDLS